MLKANRVTIGPFVPDDFGPLFCWANDAAAASLDYAYRPVDMMAHQQWWDSLNKDAARIVFAIRKIAEPALIGYVQITGINPIHRSAEMGIRIGEEKNRGQGYGKEALALAADFCWNHLNLNRVQLVVFRHNHRAVAAYSAAGFKKEGRLRKASFIGGAWVDLVLMAALRPPPSRRQRHAAAPGIRGGAEPGPVAPFGDTASERRVA